ncbi:response regulator [Roseospira marina]|uniref:response regulator n=1 Tax=Roseospira marina TaxID=140057 RepID=UPI00147912A6|nr:response regulator [Roseospira marina]MBB4312780.1 CheY-like chemotaxis protein [Roseospira marina]MBB5086447.1 CheY-like chemotaxis protein [Roseospira marina]
MSQETPPSARLQRVLLVDDEDALRVLLELAVRDIGGLDTLACATCREAREQVAVFQPDLLVVDVQLPDGDGLDLVDALTAGATPPGPPAVLLTARPDAIADRAARMGSVAGVLAKPFDPMTLSQTLDQLWRDWSASRHA